MTTIRDDAPSTIVGANKDKGAHGDLRAVVPALTILWHYDLRRVGQCAPLARGLTEVSRYTAPFDSSADVVLSRNAFLLVHQSDKGIELRTAGAKTSVVVDCEPLSSPRTISAEELQRGIVIALADQIVVCLHQLRTPVLRGPTLGLVGSSDAIESVRRQIVKVATLDLPVILRGESGTGKELVARAVASASRTPTPFVAINMGEIPPSMAAATLFGHEKGAFTGAGEAHSGIFAEADGGTLFLDEIASTPVEVQKMLLRVLETGEIRALGSRRSRKVKVRLISATDKDLDAAVGRGTFEGPLLNRIQEGYQIDLPPLRDRREDVGALFLHFLRQKLAATGELDRLDPRSAQDRPWLDARDFARIAASPFPGNLRTLNHCASQIVVSNRGQSVALLDSAVERILSESDRAPATIPPTSRRSGQPTDAEIQQALRGNAYNLAAAASELGIHRSTLYDRMEKIPGAVRSAGDVSDGDVLEAHARHGGDINAMATAMRIPPKPLKTRVDEVLRKQRRV